MTEWNVHTGTFDAAYNLAIDDLMMEKARETGEKYLRIYDFENPAVILARNEHYNDLKSLKEDIDYARRDTGGSVIYCDDNALFYSVTVPAGENEYPEELHREFFGPRIASALSDLGVDDELLGVGEHFSVRIDGKTVSGNSQRKKNDAVMYHGVLALEPWAADELEELIELREKQERSEKEFIDSLPGVLSHTDHSYEEARNNLEKLFVEKFTGGEYSEMELSDKDMRYVESMVESKYGSSEWLKNGSNPDSLNRDQGFCFVDWTDEWNESIDDYGFH
jgi:lipoate-protein ligase A